jgi:hypothetical protein
MENRGSLSSAHIHSTYVPGEASSTASIIMDAAVARHLAPVVTIAGAFLRTERRGIFWESPPVVRAGQGHPPA